MTVARVYFEVSGAEYDILPVSRADFDALFEDPVFGPVRAGVVGYPAFYREDDPSMLWPTPPSDLVVKTEDAP
jgi:hypothetical protein